MRRIPIAAVAVLALTTVAATAQTTSPTTPRPASPGTATAPAPVQREPAINPLTKEDLSNIEGTTVYGGDDAKIGYVSTVLMDPQTSEKIDRLVVTAGEGAADARDGRPSGGHVDRPVQMGCRKGPPSGSRRHWPAWEVWMPEWVEGAETATGSKLAGHRPENP